MSVQFGKPRRAQRAVTLTELLVVLAIIGLLATIAIPVYMTRMETARIRTAQLECREIAQAEETCAIFHGFYLPIQLLDNLSEEDAGPAVFRTPLPADTWANESLVNLFVIDPFQRATIQAQRIFPNPGGQMRLSDTGLPRINSLLSQWQGPFLNAQRIYRRPLPGGVGATNLDVRRDFPLDPWKQPYRFFSPIGPIGQQAMVLDVNNQFSDVFSDGRLMDDPVNDPFDRYAIVSFGPNQFLDDPADPTNDDIFYTFGIVFVASSFYAYYQR